MQLITHFFIETRRKKVKKCTQGRTHMRNAFLLALVFSISQACDQGPMYEEEESAKLNQMVYTPTTRLMLREVVTK